jgi:TatD DNase family protein
MQTWIDTHCHLTDPKFAENFDETLVAARDAGVGRIVVVGDTLESSREALVLARRHDWLYATAGLHPHHADDWSDAAASELHTLCRSGMADGALVAVGETGLDFFYDHSRREAQVTAFLGQAEIARQLNLPMVVHCRDAYDLLLELIHAHRLGEIGGVVHCFAGTLEQAHELVGIGFFLGIGGTLTFKKNDLGREVARSVPLDSLVIETDAPYLAPVPKRGKRNEPAFVAHTAFRLAEELGVPPDDLAQALAANTRRLFPTLAR